MSKHIEKPTDITVPATGLWARLPIIGGVLGLGGLGVTVGMMFGPDKSRAFFSYLFAFEFVLSIALGALGFVLIQHVTRAGWSAVVRRVPEAMMATLPLFFVLFLPIAILGFHDLYPWSHETDMILERKRWWLMDSRFMMRAGAFFLIWTGLSQLLYRWSVQQDSLGEGEARDAVTRKLWTLSAGGIFLFALSLSFAAVDWLMSLQPHWYSTIFGVYFFAGAMLCFYAFTTLAMMALQNGGMLKNAVTTEHYHDLGKFVFGHTIFWAYIAFSQFVLIWYANIPEETEFYMNRVEGGWQPISYALPVVHFFLPFLFLVSRHVKRSRKWLAVGAVYTICMHVLDIYWLVMPNFGAHGGGEAEGQAAGEGHAAAEAAAGAVAHHGPHFAIHFLDITALVGMLGIFLAAFGWVLKRNNVVCINEPRLEESLAHENF